MKTPNKIYINTLNIDKGDNHWFIGKNDNPADKKYDVEYIRKDFLIDKLARAKALRELSGSKDTEVFYALINLIQEL